MTDTESRREQLPASIARVLQRFRALGREEKMQALVSLATKLEPVPERYADVDTSQFNIPECQTRVDLFPEIRDGKMHYYARVDCRQSPTVAAFLAILFSAINDQPPSTTLALPADFAAQVMESVGLATRELGLNAMVERVKRYARNAQAAAA
jgi:cysteine desulfuration protein SufE